MLLFLRKSALDLHPWRISLANIITVDDVREWFNTTDSENIIEFLDCGLNDLIESLEQDDFFGTEGFNKRFA